MAIVQVKDLIEAGVHFGHLKKKWNPKMLPYIFMEKKGIHIIDLYKTKDKLEEAAAGLRSVARSGKKILHRPLSPGIRATGQVLTKLI